MTIKIKKITIVIMFFLTGILQSDAQVLTLTNLKSLFQNNLEFSNEFLTNKGFNFSETIDFKDEGDFGTTWTYNRNISNNYASYFITKSSSKKNWGIIFYQVLSGSEINLIKNQCKAIGYKLVKVERDKLGSLNSIYSNGVYDVIFTSGIIEESNTNGFSITFQKHYGN
jgi:hypothetical protein